MGDIQYIGSKITLVSYSEIRYEGILASVDPQEATITLHQVRMLGTEGRRKGVNEMAARQEIYEVVQFRSRDIKDLEILQAPSTTQRPPQPVSQAQPNRPPVAFGSLPPQNNNTASMRPPAQLLPSFMMNEVDDDDVAAAPIQFGTIKPLKSGVAPAPAPAVESKPAEEKVLTYSTGTGRLEMVDRDVAHSFAAAAAASSHRSAAPPVPKTDFDFAQSNSRLSLDDLMAGHQQLPAAGSAAQYYSKETSFFDNISSQARDGRGDTEHRNDNRLNIETFGATRVHNNPSYYRGGGRGRGNGQYGRGGYNGNYGHGGYGQYSGGRGRYGKPRVSE